MDSRLASRIGNTAGRFIADDSVRLGLAELATAQYLNDVRRHFHGKSVVLALPKQLETVAALIALDGIARRIVLWPHDLPHDGMAAAKAAAAVDFVVTSWPPSKPDFAAPAHDAANAFMAAAAMAPRATEWVLFTSGTTAQPKMVAHTLQTLAGHLLVGGPKAEGPVWCTFYDIRRYGGLQVALRALLGGGSLVLSSPDEPPGAFLIRAAAAGATHFLGTPSHWRRALMTDCAHAISPTYVRLSGEPADQNILDQLHATYPKAAIVHAFASTEAGLAFEVTDVLAGFPAGLLDAKAGTARIKIKNGALNVGSSRIADGYLHGDISRIADADGMVDTGDLVELRNGRYYFIGRRDGAVNVGGQKVHPEEVEAVINQHPDVQMSLVKARRSPITGTIVVADVVLRPRSPGAEPARDGENSLEAQIRALCRERLPPHKVPVSIRTVPSISVAPSGKLVRVSA